MENIERIINDLSDDDILNFYDNVHEAQTTIEINLMHIHEIEEPQKRYNAIASAIDHLKTQCHRVFLDPLSGFIQTIEDLFNLLMNKEILITERISELLLLCVDEIRVASESLLKQGTIDIRLLDDFREMLHKIIDANDNDFAELVNLGITKFSVRVEDDLVFCAREIHSASIGRLVEFVKDPDTAIPLPDYGDLDIFKSLSDTLDSRIGYWQKRTEKILYLCLLINKHLKNGVSVEQLAAAVYMHDTAMAYLSDTILTKKSKLSTDEFMMLQQHPLQIYEIMKLMPDWNEAALMVRHHHERIDGSGYPDGLKSNEICTGAKIIAIADTFYSITHLRSDRQFKKSITRGISEINKYNNIQFDHQVVSAFNQGLKSFLNEAMKIDKRLIKKII